MHNELEIMFEDLKPEIQKQFLDFMELENAEEGNYDIFPIAIIGKE